ncbi:hypothetical protein XELAEV_18018128mg [Xenopus laevis]|uniref:Uncharacterized protein n=1 Tax=Xenopus laevis TaxID=8355 RepID=A0A974HT47_XENLA|nr:hypothetical protein XELAEV_18018128mg [Xenopus laevis]
MTFAYSDQDAKRITDAVVRQNEFLNSKDCFQEFHVLERLQRIYIAYDLHLRTLAEYVKLQRIPRGLRAHLSPTLFSDNDQYCTKWEAIVNKCSLDLMLLTMEQLQSALPEVKGEADRAEENIRNSFAIPAVSGGMAKLTDHLAKFRAEVEGRKRNKFKRDAEDYKAGNVYRWKSKGYGGSPRNPSTSSISFLDGSQATATSEEESVEGASTKKQPRAYNRRRPKRW